MANFKAMLPTDLLEQVDKIDKNSDAMIREMVEKGENVVYSNVQKNMRKAFKSTKSLQKGLVKSKPKTLKGADGYGGWVGFTGYDTSKKTKKYPQGIPIPLKAMAREYGTKRGESKKPFLRPSVNDAEIENAMQQVQDKYIPKE